MISHFCDWRNQLGPAPLVDPAAPPAQQALPWCLSGRNRISFREVLTGAALPPAATKCSGLDGDSMVTCNHVSDDPVTLRWCAPARPTSYRPRPDVGPTGPSACPLVTAVETTTPRGLWLRGVFRKPCRADGMRSPNAFRPQVRSEAFGLVGPARAGAGPESTQPHVLHQVGGNDLIVGRQKNHGLIAAAARTTRIGPDRGRHQPTLERRP
jgi:hypothetical protein